MIYCVEDEDGIRELIVYTLRASGFEAEGFADSEGLWQALKKSRPRLIILDIMLPGEEGTTVLRKLKSGAVYSDIPVIMASAKGTEYDKVKGLDLGADDYLAKPFGMMEMVSRVRAVLRRSGGYERKVLSAGGISLDLGRHTVSVNEEEVELTLKEFETLRLFMENPGTVFTRDVLLTKVWGMDYMGETRTVDVHIGTLRSKLGAAGEMIRTVRGVGYKLEEKI